MIQKHTIGIIGTGNVGVAAAYALFLNRTAGEIILIDKDPRRAEGEAMDLMHGQPYVGHISIRAGDYRDLARAQVIVVSAGVSQKPGENRLDLLNRNAAVLRQIAAQLDRYAPEAVLVVASNPVDILTYTLQQLTERPAHRVVGTGTMLDTGRFRSLLGGYYHVDPRSVHAYIIGEHGDSEVPLWSSADIGGVSIVKNTVLGKTFDAEKMRQLFVKVRDAAYQIIDRKGYTNTAIGSVIGRLCEAILEDQKSVFTVSTRIAGEYGLTDLCLSVPAIVGLDGVEATVLPELTKGEKQALHSSADVIRQNIDGMAL